MCLVLEPVACKAAYRKGLNRKGQAMKWVCVRKPGHEGKHSGLSKDSELLMRWVDGQGA